MDIGPTGGPSPVGEEMEKDEHVCALFATSMPRDLWANPSLAALAGLIDEDEDQKDKSVSQVEQAVKETSDQATPREDVSKADGPGSANGTEGESSSCPAAATESLQTGTGGSSGTSGARHQRREDTRRRRHDRRATPYGTAAGVGGRRGRGEDSSSELGLGRRKGPTTGETQVLMSLWGL